MNHDRIEGKWKQLRGILRERWGELAADQPGVAAGRHDRRTGRAQERYGIRQEEAQRQLNEFLRRNRHWNTSSR